MQWTNVKGNTWVLEGAQLVGVYRIDETRCILVDPGSEKLRPELDHDLRAAGLTPVGVICTHMHYDHHESSQYFRKTYGAAVCLPQLEADIVRSERSLKNHLFNFTMGLVRTNQRLQNLIGPVDRIVAFGETKVDLGGAELTIVRTPGHSPDHICVVTPDNVCFAGDALMTEDVLETAMVPFAFDLADDLRSKEAMKDLGCDAYVLCHKGMIHGSIAELVQKNLDRVRGQLAAIRDLVTGPMTYSEFYAKVIGTMDLAVGHPIRAQYLERYIRPYLEYLVDIEALTLIDLAGAPAVQPAGETNHE